jgi:hypothetical protein
MAVPHTLVTVSGIFGEYASPVEEWSWGMRFSGPLGATVPVYQAEANAVRAAYLTHLAPLFRAQTQATRFRVASITDTGHVAKGPDGEYLQADNIQQTLGTNATTTVMPLSSAVVVGLDSNRAGPTGKGRIFLPFPGYTLDASYRLPAASATGIANAVAAFVRVLDAPVGPAEDNAPGLGPLLVVSSKGYVSPVVRFRVGLVPDSMRSRRGRVPEQYQSVAL